MSHKLVKPDKSEVFKIQRPMASSFSTSLILIYNKSRSVYAQIPMTQEIAKMMGTGYKIYVKGHVDNAGILQIEEKVSPQKW